MKKSFLLIAILSLCLTCTLKSQIKVNSSGHVGINNTSPTYRLDVNGNVRFTATSKSIGFDGASFYPMSNVDLGTLGNYWFRIYSTYAIFTYDPIIMSDLNYKTDISNLTGMMEKIKLLRPVTFKLRTDAKDIGVDKTTNPLQYGFIAQELKEIFPDMVSTQPNEILGIHYSEIIPVLVQAVKEQQEQIDALSKRVSELEQAAGK